MSTQKRVGSSPLDRIVHAANQLRSRLAGDGPFSLCEAGLDEHGYESLNRWVEQSLNPTSIRSRRWEVGAVVFRFIAETARRDAKEGSLWSSVHEKFPADIRSLLFLQGQPLPRLKEMIEQAVRKLNLRHVLDREDTLKWYVTTYLQFGCTHRGLLAHLPQWLCGSAVPTAVDLLLSGDMASEGFRDVWQALRYYRRDWVTEYQVRSLLTESPWIASKWADDVLRLAREHPAGLISVDPLDEPDAEPTILSVPRIEWMEHDEPRFLADVQDLKQLRLLEPHYDVLAGGLRLATIFRQPNGEYQPDRLTVELPCRSPNLAVHLVDINKSVCLTQFVELWNPSSDVNVFEMRTGETVDGPAERSLHVSKDYILLVPNDLLAEPEFQWVRIGGGIARTAILIRSPWQPDKLRLLSRDGDVVWHPESPLRRRDEPEPTWARNLTLEVCGRPRFVRVGDLLQVTIRGAPATATLVYARAAGQPIQFDPATGKLNGIRMSPEAARSGLKIQLGIRNPAGPADAAVLAIRRRLDIAVQGAVELAPEGWVPVDSRRTRTVESCRERAFRVCLPAEVERAVVMEGPLRVGWVGNRASPLRNVAGTGAPLVVRREPFNCEADLLSLAIGVTNGGVLREARADTSVDGYVELTLTRPILPSDDHAAVFWASGGEPTFVPAAGLAIIHTDGGRRWRFPRPTAGDDGSTAIVAISFKGRLLGTASIGGLPSFFSRLNTIAHHGSRILAAALIRWCEAPVLLRERATGEPVFAEFAQAFPKAVFSGWLTGDGLPHSLSFNMSFQRRQIEWSQLRALYGEWDPSAEQAAEIIELIVPTNTNGKDPLLEALLQLLPELPQLAGKVAQRWIDKNGAPCPRSQIPAYFHTLRHHLGLLDNKGKPKDLNELLRLAADSLRVDPSQSADEYFVRYLADAAVDAACDSHFTGAQSANFQVASQVGSFRQYMGQRVLTKLEKELVGR